MKNEFPNILAKMHQHADFCLSTILKWVWWFTYLWAVWYCRRCRCLLFDVFELPVVTKNYKIFCFYCQVAPNTSVSKAPVSTTAGLTSQTATKAKVSNTATQPVSSASKTVVMTTLVGGTKRVVLSVPAPLQAGPNISTPTTCSSPQGMVITKTQGKCFYGNKFRCSITSGPAYNNIYWGSIT